MLVYTTARREFTPDVLWLSSALEMLRANARYLSMIRFVAGEASSNIINDVCSIVYVTFVFGMNQSIAETIVRFNVLLSRLGGIMIYVFPYTDRAFYYNFFESHR